VIFVFFVAWSSTGSPDMRLTVIIALLTSALSAQTPPSQIPSSQTPPSQTPLFRTATTLVEFSVAALDGGGHPVADLTTDDVSITEEGQPREIAFFRFVGAPDVQKPEPLPYGVFTNRPEYTAGPPVNITAIVIDGILALPAEQIVVRTQLLRYLDTVPRNTRVAVYHMGWRTTVLHDFTDDIKSLRARIAKIDADSHGHATDLEIGLLDSLSPEARETLQQATIDMNAQEQDYRATVADRKRALTLSSLEALGNQLAGIPGRKSLVWITPGTPIYTNYRFREIHEAQIRRTAQRLATQGIAVYPVDTHGLDAPPMQTTAVGRGSSRIPPPTPPVGIPDRRLQATMDLVADVTGGRVARNTNDFTQGAKDAAADLRGAYIVGFYATGEPDNKWHDVDVKVKRRGVRLSHRQGYLAEATRPQPNHWSDPQWRWAIMNPLGSTVIHLDARFERVPKAEPNTYDLLLLIPPEELHFRKTGNQLSADVEVVVAEKLPDGRFSYRVEERTLSVPDRADRSGNVVRFMDRWTLRPGASTIRLIVRDRVTSRYGTLDVAVKQLS
jgi:VWFA-related protein